MMRLESIAVDEVAVVLHENVNVMEDDAVEVKQFPRFQESDVHHRRLVEYSRKILEQRLSGLYHTHRHNTEGAVN